jgi:hypothetical protein
MCLWENTGTKDELMFAIKADGYDFPHPCDGLRKSPLFKLPLADTVFENRVLRRIFGPRGMK